MRLWDVAQRVRLVKLENISSLLVEVTRILFVALVELVIRIKFSSNLVQELEELIPMSA